MIDYVFIFCALSMPSLLQWSILVANHKLTGQLTLYPMPNCAFPQRSHKFHIKCVDCKWKIMNINIRTICRVRWMNPSSNQCGHFLWFLAISWNHNRCDFHYNWVIIWEWWHCVVLVVQHFTSIKFALFHYELNALGIKCQRRLFMEFIMKRWVLAFSCYSILTPFTSLFCLCVCDYPKKKNDTKNKDGVFFAIFLHQMDYKINNH